VRAKAGDELLAFTPQRILAYRTIVWYNLGANKCSRNCLLWLNNLKEETVAEFAYTNIESG